MREAGVPVERIARHLGRQNSSLRKFIADAGPSDPLASTTAILPAAGTTSVFGQSVTPDVASTLTMSGRSNPTGLAFNSTGALFVVNYYSNNVEVISATPATIFGQMVNADTATALTANGVSGSGNLLSFPTGIAFDAAGDLFVSSAPGEAQTVPLSLCRTPALRYSATRCR